MTPLQQKAAEARAFFTRSKRISNDQEYIHLIEGAPDWARDLCREAHAGMSPDDYKYEFILDAICKLEEYEDPDDIIMPEEVYNSNLAEWLASNVERFGFCDNAVDDVGIESLHTGSTTFTLLSMGYAAEQNEVLGIVRGFLESHIGPDENADEGTTP